MQWLCLLPSFIHHHSLLLLTETMAIFLTAVTNMWQLLHYHCHCWCCYNHRSAAMVRVSPLLTGCRKNYQLTKGGERVMYMELSHLICFKTLEMYYQTEYSRSTVYPFLLIFRQQERYNVPCPHKGLEIPVISIWCSDGVNFTVSIYLISWLVMIAGNAQHLPWHKK